MIVDFQQHYLPEEFKDKGRRRPPAVYDIGRHLHNMDVTGIDVAVLSSWTAALEECKVINDRLAQLQVRHPGRLVGLAHVPPLGGKEAFAELARSVEGLGLKGVIITAQVEDVSLDDERLWPFYEEVQKLGIPLFVHPSYLLKGFPALDAPYNLAQGLGWELELLTATVRLILGGVVEKFPELKIVVSHFGGGIASIVERLTGPGRGRLPIYVPTSTKMNRPFGEYLDRLYFDMAGFSGGMVAVRCYLAGLKPEKLIFGTDYPMNFDGEPEETKAYIQNIRRLDLSGDIKDGILGNTAAKLLG
ncbi:MAG: amidohydrolase, partial [Chloroflexi bacterium]|nr:amidohydrolase [Chloroflexota bacterium]